MRKCVCVRERVGVCVSVYVCERKCVSCVCNTEMIMSEFRVFMSECVCVRVSDCVCV